MLNCLFPYFNSRSADDLEYWVTARIIPNFNIKKINCNIKSIRQFIYATVSQIVNDNYRAKHIDVNICSHPSDVQELNGLLLSSDGSVLYAVTDTDVEALVIPASVSAVGDGAFMGCTRLRSVRFLGGLTKIGHGVFTNDMLIEGDFSHLSYIGYNASASAISIGDQTKPIVDWAYMFNKDEIDSIEIKVDIVHIEH